MGTRADFYVGKGKTAEWLGSIAWDGYRDGIDLPVRMATTEADYRTAVSAFLAQRSDATLPSQGWPWPWDDSRMSDCSYWFFDGAVHDTCGYPVKRYCPCDQPQEESESRELIEYPDMSDRKKVTFGKRSGLLILGG